MDATRPAFANWLSLVARSPSKRGSNLVPVIVKGSVYFASFGPISKNTELVVWSSGDLTLSRSDEYFGADSVGRASEERTVSESERPTTTFRDADDESVLERRAEPNSSACSSASELSILELPWVKTLLNMYDYAAYRFSRRFKCPKCYTVFYDLEYLGVHELHCLGNADFYTCGHCAQKFKAYKLLAGHVATHHKAGSPTFDADREEALIRTATRGEQTNLNRHTAETAAESETGTQELTRKENVDPNESRGSPKPPLNSSQKGVSPSKRDIASLKLFKCSICDAWFFSAESKEGHEVSDHRIDQSILNLVFRLIHQLARNTRAILPTKYPETKTHECEVCLHRFTSLFLLLRHKLKIHVQLKKFLIILHDILQMSSSKVSESHLYTKIKQVNLKVIIDKLTVGDREDSIPSIPDSENAPSSLFNDSKDTDEDSPLCDKMKDIRPILKMTESKRGATTNENRPGSKKCPECGVVLGAKTSLKIHLHSHNSLRNFECDKCGTRFKHFSSLRRHARSSHGRARRFRCSLCPKTFSQLSNLARHEKVHRGLALFKCKLCPKSYVDQFRLDRHLESH